MAERMNGWRWFDESATTARQADDEFADITRAFTRCFAGRNGKMVLVHLRALTNERFLGPEASDATLRHLEGQRHLVAYIASMVERGRAGN